MLNILYTPLDIGLLYYSRYYIVGLGGLLQTLLFLILGFLAGSLVKNSVFLGIATHQTFYNILSKSTSPEKRKREATLRHTVARASSLYSAIGFIPGSSCCKWGDYIHVLLVS